MSQFEINEDWAMALGRSLIAFGAIEHAVHICIKSMARDPILVTTSDLNLSKKIDLALAIAGQYQTEKCRGLCDMLRSAKKLSVTRNLIAHGPLVYEFYEAQDGGSHIQERIVSLRDHSKKISLAELHTFSSDATELSSNLMARALGVAADLVVRTHA